MLLELIAAVILMGMMLIPFVNIIVGVIVGGGLGGVAGSMLGLTLAVLIIAAERLAAELWRPTASSGGALAEALMDRPEPRPDLQSFIRRRPLMLTRRRPQPRPQFSETQVPVLH
jgi:hypothetical protein